MASFDPQEVVTTVRSMAERAGAAEAEVYLEQGNLIEVRVRQGEVDVVQQFQTRGLGLRVFCDRRMGFGTTTDIRKPVLDELVNRTVALAREAAPREENRLSTLLFTPQAGLELSDPDIENLVDVELEKLARAAEDGAFAQGKQIESTQDARAGIAIADVYFSNSYINYQNWHGTTAWIGCTAIATAQGRKQEGTFFDQKRIFRDLEIPSRVGERAGQRALAKLGAAPRPSAKAPVIFDPESAGAFLAGLFGAFDAAQVLEQRSYLAGRVGQKIASPMLTIVDDGLMRRGLGTAPFDGEGVECHRTVVVDRGVLVNFLNTSVSARRMGVPPTGNGFRTYEALPATGPSNFYVESGSSTLERMIKDVPNGLLVTGTAGFGFDLVAGEYSQQVEGQWITNGAPAGPVEGMTVAGRLDDLLAGIDAVGNRLDFRARVASPALRFREMTIGGV